MSVAYKWVQIGDMPLRTSTIAKDHLQGRVSNVDLSSDVQGFPTRAVPAGMSLRIRGYTW
jgi:hypothetical protein